MSYLRIHNWEKWQTYRKDRAAPPWIKIHRSLLREPKWIRLSDGQRGHLISIWLLAADENGRIPNDPAFIRKVCCLDSEPDLNALVALGFLDAVKTPPRRRADAKVTEINEVSDGLETEAETETESETEIEESQNNSGADAPDDGWHGHIIHLNAADHASWKKAYAHIDLDAELVARDLWLLDQPESVQARWFPSTSRFLANRNMKARSDSQARASPRAPTPSRTVLAMDKLEAEANGFGGSEIRNGGCELSTEIIPPTAPGPGGVRQRPDRSLHREAEGTFTPDGQSGRGIARRG